MDSLSNNPDASAAVSSPQIPARDHFFKVPELILSMTEYLDVETFLDFSRTNKTRFRLLNNHESFLCPKILKNSATFGYWEGKWVTDEKSISKPKTMQELSNIHLRREVGKLELKMLSKEGYGVNMAVGVLRTRQLLTIIAREFSARWSCGLDLELDKFLRQRRLMAQEQIWRYHCTRDDHHLSRLINPLRYLTCTTPPSTCSESRFRGLSSWLEMEATPELNGFAWRINALRTF